MIGRGRYNQGMTFRAVVQDGLIVINTHGAIPDGTTVRVVRAGAPRKVAKTASRATKGPRAKEAGKPVRRVAQKPHPLLALAGIWKDRPDWRGKSSTEVVAELRRRSVGRHRG